MITKTRLFLSVKDIIVITGTSISTSRRLARAIKAKYNVVNRTYISIDEFCSYTGLKEEKVRQFLE